MSLGELRDLALERAGLVPLRGERQRRCRSRRWRAACRARRKARASSRARPSRSCASVSRMLRLSASALAGLPASAMTSFAASSRARDALRQRADQRRERRRIRAIERRGDDRRRIPRSRADRGAALEVVVELRPGGDERLARASSETALLGQARAMRRGAPAHRHRPTSEPVESGHVCSMRATLADQRGVAAHRGIRDRCAERRALGGSDLRSRCEQSRAWRPQRPAAAMRRPAAPRSAAVS